MLKSAQLLIHWKQCKEVYRSHWILLRETWHGLGYQHPISIDGTPMVGEGEVPYWFSKAVLYLVFSFDRLPTVLFLQ
ncbi:hypothetical protein ABKN59_011970 [Abortiporus biennis]